MLPIFFCWNPRTSSFVDPFYYCYHFLIESSLAISLIRRCSDLFLLLSWRRFPSAAPLRQGSRLLFAGYSHTLMPPLRPVSCTHKRLDLTTPAASNLLLYIRFRILNIILGEGSLIFVAFSHPWSSSKPRYLISEVLVYHHQTGY